MDISSQRWLIRSSGCRTERGISMAKFCLEKLWLRRLTLQSGTTKLDVRISCDLCSQTDENLQAQAESYPTHGVIGERLHEGWNQLWGSAVGLPGR